MSRLVVEGQSSVARGHKELAEITARRVKAMTDDQCQVDFTLSLVRMMLSESCGKCTPCRIGLQQSATLIDALLSGEGDQVTLDKLAAVAANMRDSADCAIGFEAGRMIESALAQFKDDFESHALNDKCTAAHSIYAPCQQKCPAHVDIPGYIACINAGRPNDALRVLRNDNPLPTVCGYVCEHPCELACRRTMVDDAVNIVGLKRYAADAVDDYGDPRPCQEATGKKIAVIGGGPAGLTAAYYLQLMGHEATIYDQRAKLGGMVRYGIPDYRLPQEKLDKDIAYILATGVKAVTNTRVGEDVTMDQLAKDYDVVYLTIGAHTDKKLGIEGEGSKGVYSAVEFLRAAGDGAPMDLSGKKVVIVGGGNVAMDCTRTAKRCGAESVECVYRRRIADMTALAEEIEEAQAEGCQITTLQAPVRVEADENGNVTALITQPQIIGPVRGGRPAPMKADMPEQRIEADVILVAIGQAIETDLFADVAPSNRGTFVANPDASVTTVAQYPVPLFAGGDAVSGPATVVRAAAAGKAAAANIDAALGYHHNVYDPVEIPEPKPALTAYGRVELVNRKYDEANKDFDIAKLGMTDEGACQESARCLRCDHYGYGKICGKGAQRW